MFPRGMPQKDGGGGKDSIRCPFTLYTYTYIYIYISAAASMSAYLEPVPAAHPQINRQVFSVHLPVNGLRLVEFAQMRAHLLSVYVRVGSYMCLTILGDKINENKNWVRTFK